MYVFIEIKLGYKLINFISYKQFIAFVVTPSENDGIFCHFGGYDKGFYGIYNNLINNKLIGSNSFLVGVSQNSFKSSRKTHHGDNVCYS